MNPALLLSHFAKQNRSSWMTRPDAIEFLTQDHRNMENLAMKFESSTSMEEKHQLAQQIIKELSQHTVAEEMHLYPFVKNKVVPEHEAIHLSEHGLHEHKELKQALEELQKLPQLDQQFEQQIHTILKKMKHHHKDEERDVFPLMRNCSTREELLELGSKLQHAKENAPTKPHSWAPFTPPLNTISNPILAMVDKMTAPSSKAE